MSRHLQVNDPASDVSFDDTIISTASSGSVTGNDVQEILDNFVPVLLTLIASLFASIGAIDITTKVDKAGDTMTGTLIMTTNDNQIDVNRPADTNRAIINFKTGGTAKWRLGEYNNGGSDENFVLHKSGGGNPIEVNFSTEATTISNLSAGNGATGTFTTTDLKTVTVTNGIITSIV